jgi:hypothetical protein
MALVNPNIAMSYRPTVEYQPRNALAEAAQIQQIMGGQRQAEMADMQMEALRRKDRAISQIQAAAAKNGGPTDRREIARAYVQSGVPEFMQFGLTLEKDLDELCENHGRRRSSCNWRRCCNCTNVCGGGAHWRRAGC